MTFTSSPLFYFKNVAYKNIYSKEEEGKKEEGRVRERERERERMIKINFIYYQNLFLIKK